MTEDFNPKKDTIILALETSCDETAAAIVKNGVDVLANVIHSQIDIHKIYGGVVPEIASREHINSCNYVVDKCLSDAKLTFNDIDYFAVTYGPGLVGALLTGVTFMKALSYSLKKKLIPVNHIHGHIYSNFISSSKPKFPLICLVVSGGHTNIVLMKDNFSYEIIGSTIDDAAGEVFDKAARILGLEYPGGPKISFLAQKGDKEKYILPTPKTPKKYDFSFSGLKTAFINLAKNSKADHIYDLSACLENKIIDILVEKSISACMDYNIKNLCIAGGVSANTFLREKICEHAKENGIKCTLPDLEYCTDNAAMIASAAFYGLNKVNFADLTLNAVANLEMN